MRAQMNAARTSSGLGELAPHDGLRDVARRWAAQMAADHDASGDRKGTLRHNPSLSSQLPEDFAQAGENVGYTVLTDASDSTLIDRLHESYMASPAHRENIMGEYDRVGVGLVTSEDGTMWSAVVFMLQEAAAAPAPPADPPAAEELPPPEPPSTEELFGAAWPEGYLAGDRGAALTLLAGRHDVRGAVSLLPRTPSRARLLGHFVAGI